MGLIERLLSTVFGDGRNVIVETAEVFRENSEKSADRDATIKTQSMQQYAAEFAVARNGWFDRLMDGLNRLPRPLLAFGTIGLFIVAMVDPLWFSSRMQGIALVPDPLWWLMGAIVSFYFGARHQAHSQAFQRSIAETLARVPTVVQNTMELERLRDETLADPSDSAPELGTGPANNPALEAWYKERAP